MSEALTAIKGLGQQPDSAAVIGKLRVLFLKTEVATVNALSRKLKKVLKPISSGGAMKQILLSEPADDQGGTGVATELPDRESDPIFQALDQLIAKFDELWKLCEGAGVEIAELSGVINTV